MTEQPARWADLSPRNVESLVQQLPLSLRNDVGRAANDARALAALGLDLLHRYHRLCVEVDNNLPTEGLSNGGDLVNAVRDAAGLTTTWDVLLGLAEATMEETASLPNESQLQRCRQHARDHVSEIGHPVVLTLEQLLPLDSDGACLCCADEETSHLIDAAGQNGLRWPGRAP